MATLNQCQAKPLGWFSGSTCAPNPCRKSDFNGTGTTTVKDLFGFLGAWLARN